VIQGSASGTHLSIGTLNMSKRLVSIHISKLSLRIYKRKLFSAASTWGYQGSSRMMIALRTLRTIERASEILLNYKLKDLKRTEKSF